MRIQQSKRKIVFVVSKKGGQCPVVTLNNGKATISDDYHSKIYVNKVLLKKSCSV